MSDQRSDVENVHYSRPPIRYAGYVNPPFMVYIQRHPCTHTVSFWVNKVQSPLYTLSSSAHMHNHTFNRWTCGPAKRFSISFTNGFPGAKPSGIDTPASSNHLVYILSARIFSYPHGVIGVGRRGGKYDTHYAEKRSQRVGGGAAPNHFKSRTVVDRGG